MPSLNMPVQRLKVAILPLDLPCSGLVTHSGEILTTGKSHVRKPDRFSLNDNMDVEKYTWTDYKNKCTNCKGVKNKTNFGQIAGIQEKLDATCKQSVSKYITQGNETLFPYWQKESR